MGAREPHPSVYPHSVRLPEPMVFALVSFASETSLTRIEKRRELNERS